MLNKVLVQQAVESFIWGAKFIEAIVLNEGVGVCECEFIF